MKRKREYRFFWIISATVWSLSLFPLDSMAQTESVSLQATLQSTQVPLNQTTRAVIEISWKGDHHRFEVLQTDPPILTNLKLNGSGSSTSVQTDLAGISISKTTLFYELQPIELGMAYLEPVTITYLDRADSSRHRLFSQRLGIEGIAPLSTKRSVLEWVGFVVVLVGIAGGITYGWRRYQKNREKKRNTSKKTVEISLEEKYHREIRKMAQNPTPHFKEAVSQLAKLIRYYLSEKYNKEFTGYTTDEILHHLPPEVGEEGAKILENFMRRSEVIQFANSPVEQSEFDYLYTQIETYLLRSEKNQVVASNVDNL